MKKPTLILTKKEKPTLKLTVKPSSLPTLKLTAFKVKPVTGAKNSRLAKTSNRYA